MHLQSIQQEIDNHHINRAMWMLEEWLNYHFYHLKKLDDDTRTQFKNIVNNAYVEQNIAYAMVYSQSMPLWWGHSKWVNMSTKDYEQGVRYSALLGQTIPQMIQDNWDLLVSIEMFEEGLIEWMRADIGLRGQIARQEWLDFPHLHKFNDDVLLQIPMTVEEAQALTLRPETIRYCVLPDAYDYAILVPSWLPHLASKQYPACPNPEHPAHHLWVKWYFLTLLYESLHPEKSTFKKEIYGCARFIADLEGAWLLFHGKEALIEFLTGWCQSRPYYQSLKLQAEMGLLQGSLEEWWATVQHINVPLTEEISLFNA